MQAIFPQDICRFCKTLRHLQDQNDKYEVFPCQEIDVVVLDVVNA